MPEIGTFGLMSGDGKRSVGKLPQATAPVLDSTAAAIHGGAAGRLQLSARKPDGQRMQPEPPRLPEAAIDQPASG